ncbi:MAG TPA: type I restriction endonuclease [Vicinamibacterales bacterium]|nr:type I restriction endonuclease [Vicinamibacterales bacterium]
MRCWPSVGAAQPTRSKRPSAISRGSKGADLIQRNRAFHRTLVNGVTVEYRTREGEVRGAQARVIDFDEPGANDWLAVNQFSVTENKHSRRPDSVLFVNGLPLAVIELKNAAEENATIWSAFQQLQTYQAEMPSLFASNAVLVVSDGVEARVGALGAAREWFKPWGTVTGDGLADSHLPELQVVIEGLFAPGRCLDLVRDFVVFDDDGSGRLVKKMAGYHQVHAVRVAVDETLRAAELARADRTAEERGRYEAGRKPGGKPGDRRIGVVWHTQGSGKSLTVPFYAGRIIREPAMENPRIVVLTDRNDLDDQLFRTFSRCQDLLRQPPVQAESRAHLRQLLSVAAGGVVFTTIHKFFPEEKGDRHPTLSERRNIVVIADEAHRSQYDFIYPPSGLREAMLEARSCRHWLTSAVARAAADKPAGLGLGPVSGGFAQGMARPVADRGPGGGAAEVAVTILASIL